MLASSGGGGYRRVVVSRLGPMPGAEKQAWKRSLGSLSAGICSVVVLELAETTVRWVASSCTQTERIVIGWRSDLRVRRGSAACRARELTAGPTHARWHSGGLGASSTAESWSNLVDLGHSHADGQNAVKARCIAACTSLCRGEWPKHLCIINNITFQCDGRCFPGCRKTQW